MMTLKPRMLLAPLVVGRRIRTLSVLCKGRILYSGGSTA